MNLHVPDKGTSDFKSDALAVRLTLRILKVLKVKERIFPPLAEHISRITDI